MYSPRGSSSSSRTSVGCSLGIPPSRACSGCWWVRGGWGGLGGGWAPLGAGAGCGGSRACPVCACMRACKPACVRAPGTPHLPPYPPACPSTGRSQCRPACLPACMHACVASTHSTQPRRPRANMPPCQLHDQFPLCMPACLLASACLLAGSSLEQSPCTAAQHCRVPNAALGSGEGAAWVQGGPQPSTGCHTSYYWHASARHTAHACMHASTHAPNNPRPLLPGRVLHIFYAAQPLPRRAGLLRPAPTGGQHSQPLEVHRLLAARETGGRQLWGGV